MKKLLIVSLLLFMGSTQAYAGMLDNMADMFFGTNQGKKFECNSNSYIFTSDQKATYTKALNMDMANETISTLKDRFASSHINAIGFNPKDGYIYGWEYGEGDNYKERNPHLVRVDADFNVYSVELKEGTLPTTRFYLGDISKDGIFYIANRHQPSNTSLLQEIQRIDLNSKKVLSKIVLDKNDTYSADFAINPKDDMIYTVNAINSQLIKIDPSNGNVYELGDVGTPRPHWITYEGKQVYYYPAYSVYNYFDKYGNFYFQVNGDEVYKIDISTPWSSKDNQKARSSKYKDVGGIQAGDGARCALSAVEEIVEPTPEPFTCKEESFISFNTQGWAGDGNSSYNTISLKDGSILSEDTLLDVNGVNSIGYNILDNYVWGWNIGAEQVVRIDVNKRATLYDIEGLEKRFYVAADVDKHGILHLFSRGSAIEMSHIARVDLNTMQKLEDITLNKQINTADFAFHPDNGKLYFVSSETDNLYSITFDGNNGTVDSGTSMSVENMGDIIINYFDADGNFYFNKGTQEIYKFNVATSTAAEPFSTLDKNLRNGDGARCPLATVEEPPTTSGVCYAIDDTQNKLYSVSMSLDATNLPIARSIDLDISRFDGLKFDGEGGAYNSKTHLVYAFDEDEDGESKLYSINPSNAEVNFVKSYTTMNDNIVGASFYGGYFYVLAQNEEDSAITAFYKIDTSNWEIKESYELNGDVTHASALAINKDGLAYITIDTDYGEEVGKIFTINLDNAHTTYTGIQIKKANGHSIESEGLSFAEDGNLYIENSESNKKYDQKIYKINLSNGDVVAAAQIPIIDIDDASKNVDIEGLSCNVIVPDTPHSEKPTITISDASILEGDDGIKDIVFNITSNIDIEYSEGLKLSYTLSDGTAKVGEDYKQFQGSFFMTGKSYSVSLPIIKGDKKVEADEDFFIHFTAPIEKESATFVNATAKGTIVDDDKPKQGTCYATTDNYQKLFIYDNLDETDGLSNPKEIDLTELVTGEGGAYRALDGYMYAFSYSTTTNKMDLKKIDIHSGKVTDAKKGLLPKHVDSVEFFYDKEKKIDVMYVTDKHAGKFYTIDTSKWEKVKEQDIVNSAGEKVKIGALAIDPYSGKIYGVRDHGGFSGTDDTAPILYGLDISEEKVIATKLATLPRVDAEGLAFANDGKLYLETEEVGSEDDEHKIYRLDLQNYTLTKVAHTGTKGLIPSNTKKHSYVDIETLSCDGGKYQVPPMFTIVQKEINIDEGNINQADGTNGEDINITINANKNLTEDVEFIIAQKDESAKLGEDYKHFITNSFVMPKGSSSVTFSQHSVIADTKVESNEYFTCEFSSSKGEFKDGNVLKVNIIDDDVFTLNAFDIEETSQHPVIKTKKVYSSFLLKVAAVDAETKEVKGFEGFEDILVRIVPAEACVSEPKDIPDPSTGFELLRDDILSDGTILQPFNVVGAIKDAKVQFWWKGGTACSSDVFAVRPDKYTLSVYTPPIMAGKPWPVAGKPFDVNITAVDVRGFAVTNYTEQSNVYELDINETEVINHNPKCKLGKISEISRTPFSSGRATVKLKYSDIGKLEFKVSEITNMATEYANSDATDGSEDNRFISESPTTTKNIVASKLITSYSFTTQNSADSNYTYYSKNPSIMGAMIDVNVSVQNEDGKVVKNFTDGCYAEDVNISIVYQRSGELVSGIDFNATDVSLSGGNLIEYQVDDSNFTDGNASRRVYMNFGRDTMHMKKPLKVRLTTTQAELTDVPDAIPNINKSISFLYARAHVQNEITVVGKELNATVDYEVYLPSGNGTAFDLDAGLAKSKDDLRWSVLNQADVNLTFSSANLVYPDSDVSVTKVDDKLIKINTTKTPKKNRIEYKAPSYLMHSDTDPNAVSDSFASSLQSDKNHWSGKGNRGKVFDDTASREIKRRMEW